MCANTFSYHTHTSTVNLYIYMHKCTLVLLNGFFFVPIKYLFNFIDKTLCVLCNQIVFFFCPNTLLYSFSNRFYRLLSLFHQLFLQSFLAELNQYSN